jgi:hypothetical protein
MTPRTVAARAAWGAFALTLPIYWITMNRTIGFIDRGELAAAAFTFGIPHPTGYPTLMLVAGAVSHLVPLRPVLVLNALVGILVGEGRLSLRDAALLPEWQPPDARAAITIEDLLRMRSGLKFSESYDDFSSDVLEMLFCRPDMARYAAAKASLFPTARADLETECSCPDYANPCKHIAAVYYLLGEEFDRDPFLLFRLPAHGSAVERKSLCVECFR